MIPVERIPRRYTGKSLAGLGDLLDEYNSAISDSDSAYSWLSSAQQAVAATGSSTLSANWQKLLMTGESLRTRAAAIHYQPSIPGFIENFFGASSNIPIVGTIDRLISSDLSVWTADAQQFLSDVAQLKLAVGQYQRLVASGVSPSDASNTIDQAQQSFFSKVGSALKWPAISITSIAVVVALVIFMPEIKAGFAVVRRAGGTRGKK